MKIVVTGALGNVGKPLIEELVKKGHSVTGIIRDPNKQKDLRLLGAKVAVGSVKDPLFLKTVFRGVDAIFCMIPPDYTTPDQMGHYKDVADSYATAIIDSGIKKIVHLSSWGADLDKGTGYILGSHNTENILNMIPNVSISHLRAGFMYYNLFGFISMIKQAGFIASNYGNDDKIVMVAPSDIAAEAAKELIDPTIGNKICYVASDDRTANEVAEVLGKAINEPRLQWKILSIEEMRRKLEQKSVPKHAIENIIALNESIHNGNMRKDYDRVKAKPTGKIKIEDFAQVFASVYHKS